MASHNGLIKSGSLQGLIFYELKGKPVVRTKPSKVLQTSNTKQSADLFRVATQMGACLRRALQGTIANDNSREQMLRLNKVLIPWLSLQQKAEEGKTTDLPFLEHFQFEKKSSLQTLVRIPINCEWQQDRVVITLPGMVPKKSISAPKATHSLHWSFTALACSYGEDVIMGEKNEVFFDMQYDTSFQEQKTIELPFTMQKAEMALLIASVKYSILTYGHPQRVEEPEWSPVGVVGSCALK